MTKVNFMTTDSLRPVISINLINEALTEYRNIYR